MKVDFNFDPEDFQKAAIKEARKVIEQSLNSIVCKEHGEKPRIKWKSTNSLDAEIYGCCEDLKERAIKKIQD